MSKPLSLSYAQLRDLPCETRVATLECAGNGRVFLVPQVAGASGNWVPSAMRNGLVCHWEFCWSAPASKKTLVRSCSRERIGGWQQNHRSLPARSRMPGVCPRAKAIQPEVLIAYQMNGRDLPLDHGYPGARGGPRSLRHGFRQVADAHPCRSTTVSRILADVRLRLLGFRQWKARAPCLGRDEAEVRDLPATSLRNGCPEPVLHGFRRRVGRRYRRHGDRGEHGRRADLDQGRIPRPRSTACVASLEV